MNRTICKDCTHLVEHDRCSHPELMVSIGGVVRGYRLETTWCPVARSEKGLCGPKAKYFEQRISFLDKLKNKVFKNERAQRLC